MMLFSPLTVMMMTKSCITITNPTFSFSNQLIIPEGLKDKLSGPLYQTLIEQEFATPFGSLLY